MNTETTPNTTQHWPHDVFALAKHNETLEGELRIADLTRLHPELSQKTGALTYRVTGFTNDAQHPMLHIIINGELHMVCQRCLEEMTQTIDVDNLLHLVHSEAELDNEEDEINAILAGDEFPEKIVGSQSFDIFALLEDEVILSLPHSVTHTVCDKALPTSSGEKITPFSVLSKLKS
ncbi:YceD family protein [Hydromonas duriensis]|uniref:Large ribosomal RNA subunit accumulation protein YceD n=1 Tax=Hydromonas duriensis TaxID=1527608 RepID=A0A4R6Y770_9BURK|nr:DUF177 domain-containing protein [Hydromonas duriensis]TDR31165.1 uncharacterized protein DFR44_11234 [Hydromonas duriensis]